MSERSERLNLPFPRDAASRPRSREETIAFPFRFLMLRYIIFVVLIAFGVRFWTLQVLDHGFYAQQSENNRIRDITIRAPRGNILDRHGRVLVDSRPSMNVIVLREDITNEAETIRLLVENFGVDRETLVEQLRDTTVPRSYPIIVKRDANAADRAWIAAHEYEHPEIQLEPQPQRRYIYGEMAAQALGYVGEVSKEQLKLPKYQGYKYGDIIGKSGIEQTHNDLLMGIDGKRRVIVDRLGRVQGELEVVPPTPGRDIVTTIDLDVQLAAEKQMEGKRGVVIAMDPRNGEILAMVSKPAFDPNIFSALALRINTEEKKKEYQALLLDPMRPLYNRGVQGIYPTGSTWKILIAAAGLQEGIITEQNSRIVCGGGIQVGNRFVHCMKNHGNPEILTAISASCDGYFYRLALKLGVEKINSYVKSYGMGRTTGIDLPHEVRGIIPSREWKARVNPRDPQWKDFDTVLAGIGQGSVAVPPIQLLRAIAGLSMGGEFHTPHFIREVPGGQIENPSYIVNKSWKVDNFSDTTLRLLREGMWLAVNGPGGTAGRARIDGFDISGKTGTAQVIGDRNATGKHRDHAWFVTFAPRDNPELSMIVLVENSGFGGVNSAPVARMVYAEYFKKKVGRPVIPEQEALTPEVAAAAAH